MSVNSERRARKIQREIQRRLGEQVMFLGDEVHSAESALEEHKQPRRTRRTKDKEEEKEFIERPEAEEAIARLLEARGRLAPGRNSRCGREDT